MPTLESNHLLT